MSKMDTWFRKHDPRVPKDPSRLFAFKDGLPLVVLRPNDAAIKLAAIMAIKEGTPHEALNGQPHQFIGYASRSSGDIIDKWGRKIDTVQPGDSFCTGPEFEPPVFMRTGRVHKEVWDRRTVVVLPRPDLKLDSNTGIVVEAPDPKDLGAIVLRGGAKEVDCHIPTLNRIVTGDPEKNYRDATNAAT